MNNTLEAGSDHQPYVDDLVAKYQDRLEGLEDPDMVVMIGVHIAKYLHVMPFQLMEIALRKFRSVIRLIAWPVELTVKAKEGDIVSKLYEIDPEKEFPYFIYPAFNEQVFDRAMEELESDPDENFRHLTETGIPIPKKDSDLANKLKSGDN